MAVNIDIDAVEFDDESMPIVLDLFDKEIGEDGKILDKKIQEVEIDQYSNNEITKENFAGVLVGSKFFVTKNNASFAEHINRFCKNDS